MRLDNLFSLKYLFYVGFILAMAPLMLAVIHADFAMREMAGLSERSIYQVVEETKTTRAVLQMVGEIERKARLFVILADLSFPQPYERESYESARTQLRQALDALLKAESDNRMALLANELAEKEKLIHEQIIGAGSAPEVRPPVDEAFRGLHDAAAALWRESSNRVDRKVEDLRGHASSVREGLLLRGLALVLVSLVFVAALLAVLTRSIRQMDESIRGLGAGDFMKPIRVKGPSDLRYLGARLEWLRTRLLTLEDSKQQFMRNVSHELRAPFEGIWESTAALADEGETESEQRDKVARLKENVGKLKELFEEVLHYKRINENPLEHPKQALNMKELLDSIIEDYRPRLKEKSLAVKALIQPVDFIGEPEQMKTIVDNLLANAVKFSPEGGEIRIILRAAGNILELEVEDDGPGVAPEEAEQLFEPFFRGQAAQDLGTEGSGLGLAIVSECVANHQGKVEVVEPRLDEKGARFRVELPLREAA